MDLYQALLKPLLFCLDPETAHRMAMRAIVRGWAPAAPPLAQGAEVSFFGVKFPNKIGLAAGFDKDGEGIEQWGRLGFGFAELGTVTRHPQPGNPRPRLFRYPRSLALVNRMGFNNEGAETLAKRLDSARSTIPLGINIGKSKVTPLEEAAEDYAYSYRLLKDKGQYFVVNVSSPNTPGLRQLQDKESLARILWRLKEIDPKPPLFVKAAPDLEDGPLEELVQTALDLQLTGLVLSNTTTDLSAVIKDKDMAGGLSGEPLRDKADRVLAKASHLAGDRLILIGVGGIMGPEDAARKLNLGASLVQVYTGWVYGGPSFIPELAKSLAAQRSV
jgi:dihydroorotate dehydrogenase